MGQSYPGLAAWVAISAYLVLFNPFGNPSTEEHRMSRSKREDLDLKRLLTPAEVSAILQAPRTTLSVWRPTNRVHRPFVKIGAAVRYRPEDIEVFIAGNRQSEVRR